MAKWGAVQSAEIEKMSHRHGDSRDCAIGCLNPRNFRGDPNGRQLRVALTNPPPTGSETCTNMIGWLTPNPALPFNPLAQLRSEAGFPRSRALSSTTSRRSLASVPYRQDRVTTRPVGGIRQHALGMLQPLKLQIEGCLTPATSAAL